MPNRKTENLKFVVQYFSGEHSYLPIELSQLCLEFSGNLRIGTKSLCYITYNIPAFRGKLFKPIRVCNFREEHKKSYDSGMLFI